MFCLKWFVLAQNDVILTDVKLKKNDAKRLVIWLMFIIFKLLYPKDCSGGYFSKVFNTSSLHQTEQTIHHYDGLILYYTPA
jgi:hypothetical protein